ncbi:MAG: hypothetical protein ACRDDZ_09690 [Marinifilaceae bacterium]
MKKLFTTAAMVIALFACNKQEELPQMEGPMKVSINLNYGATRSNLGQEVGAGVYTALENGVVYFFNGENLVHTYNLTEADILSTKGFEVDLASPATHVTMIGNIPAELKAENSEYPSAPATITAFKAMSFGIANQNKMASSSDATQANQGAVKGITLLDTKGNDKLNALTLDGTEVDGNLTIAKYKASITLKPAVARIEIANNAVVLIEKANSELTNKLESFTFKGFSLNNFYKTQKMGLTPQDFFGATGTGWNPAGDGVYGGYEFAKDDRNVDYKLTEASQHVGVAYHVFPAAVKSTPHVILGATNLQFENQNLIETINYWYIDEYYTANTTTPIALEAGNVYKITSITLGGSIPTENPYEKAMKVTVTVEVTPWSVVNVDVQPK